MNRTGLKYYLRALGIGIIVTALLMGYSQKGQAQMTDEEILQRAAQLGMTESQGVLAELATTPPESNSTLQSVAESTASPAPSPAEEPAASSEPSSAGDPAASSEPSSVEEPTASSEPSSVGEPTAGSEPLSAEEPTAGSDPSPGEEPTASPASSPSEESTASLAAASAEEPTASSASSPSEDPAASPAPDSAGELITLVVTPGESSVTVSRSLEELGLVEDYRTYDRYLCDNGYDHSICSGTHEIPLGATEEEIARIICKLQ